MSIQAYFNKSYQMPTLKMDKNEKSCFHNAK